MLRFSLAIAITVLTAAGPVSARQTGEISGTVYDRDGARASGVTIVATHQILGGSSSTTTNPLGVYRLRELSPGLYTVTASGGGFPEAIREDVRVQDGETTQVDFGLGGGGAGRAVERERLVFSPQMAYSTLSGRDSGLLNSGFSLQGTLGFNLGFIQLGAGIRYSAHSFSNVSHNHNMVLPFIGLRKQIRLGTSQWFPFVAARGGVAFESMFDPGVGFQAQGTSWGGTLGIRYQTNTTVGLELGASYDYTSFGDFKAKGEQVWRACIDREAGMNMSTLLRTVDLCDNPGNPFGTTDFTTYAGTARTMQQLRAFVGVTFILTKAAEN